MPLLDSLSSDERTLFSLDFEIRQRQELKSEPKQSSVERQKVKNAIGRPPKHDTAAIMKRFWLYSWGKGPVDISAFCKQEGLSERTFRYMRRKCVAHEEA